jgi:hypothetical protein
MTRRLRIWTLASGLGACWLSGCLYYPPRDPVYFNPPKTTNFPVRSATAAPKPGSDYLPRLTLNTPGSKAAEPAEPVVEKPRTHDPLPEVPPPPPQSAAEIVLSSAPVRDDAPPVQALRCLMEKRSPEEARALLNACDPADREVLCDLLRVAARLGNPEAPRASPAELAGMVEQIEALARCLRPRAALVLDKLCFCRPRSIDTFGVYEPVEDGHAFRAAGPGRPGEHVQVYAEVRNFTSRPVGDHFETRLRGKVTIEDAPGHEVVGFTLRCTDRSRTPRQDFFVNLHFDVPPRLPPGSYTLWVEVADETPAPEGKPRPARAARRSLDFRVAADSAGH